MQKTWIISLSAIGIAGIGLAWTFVSSEPREWHEIQQLHEEIRSSMQSSDENDDGNELTTNGNGDSEETKEKRDATRYEKIAEYREKLEALPETLQKKARQQMGDFFVSRMQEKIDLVLSLPPEERNEELDRQIDEWDRRRASWEKRRNQQNASPSEKNGASTDQTVNDGGNKQNSQGSGQKKSTSRRGGWSSASKEQRDTWRRELLSRTTPEQRAKWHEYRRLMNNRRKERGLTSR